jgi:hypothetical protein
MAFCLHAWPAPLKGHNVQYRAGTAVKQHLNKESWMLQEGEWGMRAGMDGHQLHTLAMKLDHHSTACMLSSLLPNLLQLLPTLLKGWATRENCMAAAKASLKARRSRCRTAAVGLNNCNIECACQGCQPRGVGDQLQALGCQAAINPTNAHSCKALEHINTSKNGTPSRLCSQPPGSRTLVAQGTQASSEQQLRMTAAPSAAALLR